MHIWVPVHSLQPSGNTVKAQVLAFFFYYFNGVMINLDIVHYNSNILNLMKRGT